GIGRITAISFAGFKTDVGIGASGGCSGFGFLSCPAPANNPATIDRNSAGDVVGFNFNTDVITPGSFSNILEIDTNATTCTKGELSAIDGETGTIQAFAPTPGPILGTGLPGLLTAAGSVMVWLRRKRKVA